MAGKARRAAARQGQLNRRRKKSQRGPSGIPSAGAVVDSPDPASAANGTVDSDGNDGVAVAQRPSPAVRQAPVARNATAGRPVRAESASRTRGERPTAYNYVGSELRRISVLSASVVAVLIVLAILL